MRQRRLIDARPFRTKAQRIAYIRGKLDQFREERRARKAQRRRRSPVSTVNQLDLFLPTNR